MRGLDRPGRRGYVGAVKFVLWILLAASCGAAPTNWPAPARIPMPNTVPTPPLPGINIPEGPLVPRPANPYLLPLTNAPARPKAMMPPSMLPSGADMMREGLRFRPPPPSAASIAATQAVMYVEPRQPAPPVVVTNQTLYVDANGSDQNDGTKDKPWRTIQKAAAAAQPGDTVLVAPGFYEGFKTKRSGKPQQPIVFKAQGEVVILTNTNTPADHILVRGTDWIVIEGFICRDAPRSGIGVLDASDVVISNNICGGNAKWGIFTGFTPRIQILHNKAFSSREQHGIYVSNSRVPDDNPVLRGNECFDNGAGGIHLTDEPDCGKPSHNNIVANNTIVEPRIAAIRLSDGARQNVIFNNLIGGRGIADEVRDNQIDADTNIHGDLPADFFADPAAFNFRLGYNSRAAYAGKAMYAEKAAPTNDIFGVTRSLNVPSVGAYDVAPAQR